MNGDTNKQEMKMNANQKNMMNFAADQVDAALATVKDEMWAAVSAAIEFDSRAADRIDAARAHAQAVLDKISTIQQIINAAA
jgi:hypothetical protein